MIYLSDSVRRQPCVRLGPIILFELNEDKGMTNLLPSCTIHRTIENAPSTFAVTFVSFEYTNVSARERFSTDSAAFQ